MGKNAEPQTSSDCRTVTAFHDYPTQADSRKELRNTIIPSDIQGSNQSGLKLTALPRYVVLRFWIMLGDGAFNHRSTSKEQSRCAWQD
jgi:hypothetical protein